MSLMPLYITKKRKAVQDGLFHAELNKFFMKELAEDGYSGLEVRRAPMHTEVWISATRTQNVLGERARRIRELTALVQKRFGFKPGQLELCVEKVAVRGLCATAQCESLRYKLVGGLPVRRACYGVLRFIMEAGARGCEVVVSGKLRGQRAKSMKFSDGVMIHSGEPVKHYVQEAVRHVLMRQGVLGIKVKIMLPHDSQGNNGPLKPPPDYVEILDLVEAPNPAEPFSEHIEVIPQVEPQQPQQPPRVETPAPAVVPMMVTVPPSPGRYDPMHSPLPGTLQHLQERISTPIELKPGSFYYR